MDKLYVAIAKKVGSYHRCKAAGQEVWARTHAAHIKTLVNEFMPSGSGFDRGTEIDLDKCSEKKLVFYTAYHAMNENFTVIVTPSLAFGFEMRIIGGSKDDRECVARIFYDALMKDVDTYAYATLAM